MLAKRLATIMAHDLERLFNLPSDIQREIYKHLLKSIEVHAVPGPVQTAPVRKPGLLEEFDRFPGDDGDKNNESRIIPLHRLSAVDMRTISMYQALFAEADNDLVNFHWEGHVRFVFPSSVAMLDVLTEWPRSRLSLIRRICLKAYPLALWPIDSSAHYVTILADMAIDALAGLRLDTLEYQCVFLAADDGFGRDAVFPAARAAMRSFGWRKLQIMMPEPYFQQCEVLEFVETAEEIKRERREPDFEIDLPTPPLRRDWDTGRIQGLAQLEEWQQKYRALSSMGIAIERGSDASGPSEEQRKETWGEEVLIRLICRRGKDADIIRPDREVNRIQPEGISSATLQALLERMTWKELRQSGDYLYSDGTDDPTEYV